MLKQLDTLIGFAVVMSVVSMLIMVATQAISATLALRGRTLRDSLQAFFIRIAPTLDPKKALALAQVVLKRPAISDSSLSIKGMAPEAWKLATAIRPLECLNAVKKIAQYREDIIKGALDTGAQADVPPAQEAARAVFAIFQSQAALSAMNETLGAVEKLVPTGTPIDEVKKKVSVLFSHASAATTATVEDWTRRFESAMDRADQWFTMKMRRVTVVLAFVTAFVLQLDAFELFSKLANDADLRNQLVNLSPSLQKRVDDALNAKFPGTVYSAALSQLKQKGEIAALPDAKETVTDAAARDWLDRQGVKPEVVADYAELVQSEATNRTHEAREEFNQMVGLYNENKLRLFPEHFPLSLDGDLPFVHHVRFFLGLNGWHPGERSCGMLAAAMLLALGAPFWFNLLKSLANLRSAVSEKIDKEQSANPPQAAAPPIPHGTT